MRKLATRYRPQNFAEVAGQDPVTRALSLAAQSDSPAAAYLLSGTRGVGKTTIARIFAKALNCEHSPCAEPCNECAQCRKIVQGSHVDVAEIDGASNNSVNDARALRENIGYAPMEGRYKIFIIDEAHMLSQSAFNALLKTLEEPPPRVVFIFATTEAHKFPITIVSRCQHFVFRHLPEETLFSHLAKVLESEGVSYEEEALRIIARRASGSVRDSLSILDQTLAGADGRLTASLAREVLGLAGRELFAQLFGALREQDCRSITDVCRKICAQGTDIGFFLRELGGQLRNMFLYRQAGEEILPSLSLGEDEAASVRTQAAGFTPACLHAAWQMTMQNQKEIGQSPEPATALEMLLINMALLPHLLPVGEVAGRPAAPEAKQEAGREHRREPVREPGPEPVPEKAAPPAGRGQENTGPGESAAPAAVGSSTKTWEDFKNFCKAENDAQRPVPGPGILATLSGRLQDGKLRLLAGSAIARQQAAKCMPQLMEAITRFFGQVDVELGEAKNPAQAGGRINELENDPRLKPCLEILDAKITGCQEKI